MTVSVVVLEGVPVAVYLDERDAENAGAEIGANVQHDVPAHGLVRSRLEAMDSEVLAAALS